MINNKLTKLKDSILNFIIQKTDFQKFVEIQIIKDFINSEIVAFPFILISVFNTQIKLKHEKSFHMLYAASSIMLMCIVISLEENKTFYETKYTAICIQQFLNSAPILIMNSIQQNLKTMSNTYNDSASGVVTIDPAAKIDNSAKKVDKKINLGKINHKIDSFICDQLLELSKIHDLKQHQKIKTKKSDIIKFKFINANIIEEKYEKLLKIDSPHMLNYIVEKYGTIGKCCFAISWLMSYSDSSKQTLDAVMDLGVQFGIIIKLMCDFEHLEMDLQHSSDISFNFIVNCGIHECYKIFDEYRLKFTQNMYKYNFESCNIMKEIMININNNFDSCLENTNLELASQYSSIISKK